MAVAMNIPVSPNGIDSSHAMGRYTTNSLTKVSRVADLGLPRALKHATVTIIRPNAP